MATAAFLAEAERRSGRRCADVFDLFCGTSTGAILALGLASGQTAHELVDLYRKFGPQLFPRKPRESKRRRYLRMVRNALRAKYESEALRDALSEEFKQTTLRDVLARGKYALVPAFCLTNGAPRIFKTDHGHLSAHGSYQLVDVALASAAAPTYFPVHSIPEPRTGAVEDFCDGGVFANDPSMLGYVEALKYLGRPAKDIQLLSVSMPRAFLGRRQRIAPRSRGFVAWGREAPAIFIDGTAETTHHVLRHIAELNESLYVRFQLENRSSAGTAVTGLDDASPQATEALMLIGTEAASSSDADQRLRPFLGWREEK